MQCRYRDEIPVESDIIVVVICHHRGGTLTSSRAHNDDLKILMAIILAYKSVDLICYNVYVNYCSGYVVECGDYVQKMAMISYTGLRHLWFSAAGIDCPNSGGLRCRAQQSRSQPDGMDS